MEYTIRPALQEDMDRILEIYASARAFMAARGNPGQWVTTRPSKERLEADIEAGDLYVALGRGEIHGVFAFLTGPDPTYQRIYGGAWRYDLPYGVLHRVAGDGSGGIFRAIFAFASARSGYLRIDTHRDNLPMRRAVQRAGFRECGVILTDDGTPRLAYDWRKEFAE